MANIDSQASAVYSRFTVSQLRDLMAAMVGTERAAQEKSRSKEDLFDRLRNLGNQKKLSLLAHRAEAVAAYKHYISVGMKQAFTRKHLELAISSAFPGTVEAFVPYQSSNRDLAAQVCVFDEVQDRIFIKFTHQVEVWETEKVSRTESRRRLVPRRHVLVVTIRPKAKLVTVSFPGFTQGQIGEERTTYFAIAKEALEIASSKLLFATHHLNLKAAADYILDDPSNGVVELKRSALPVGGGKLVLDSQNPDKDVATIVADTFKKMTADEVRKVVKSLEAGDIALHWQKSGLVTKLSFRSAEPELLFVWTQAEPSLALCERIMTQLVDAESQVPIPTLKEARAYIEGLRSRTVLRPSLLMQQFSLSQDVALNLLFSQASAGVLVLRYRVSIDKSFEGYENHWRETIAQIPKQVVDEDGVSIDTRDPSKLEIGFQRVLA